MAARPVPRQLWRKTWQVRGPERLLLAGIMWDGVGWGGWGSIGWAAVVWIGVGWIVLGWTGVWRGGSNAQEHSLRYT